MKHYRFFIIMLGVISLLASSFFLFDGASEGYAPSQPKPMKIGFVNLKKIFRDYKKVKEMEQELQREMEAELAEIKVIEEEAKTLRNEIPMFRPGSKVRRQKEEELAEKLFQIKHKKDRAEYFFREKMRRGIEKIYGEIVEIVESYAKQKGYSMILRVSDADFFESRSEEALRLEINTRDVLFWSEKDDITESIIKRMNKLYEKEQNSFD